MNEQQDAVGADGGEEMTEPEQDAAKEAWRKLWMQPQSPTAGEIFDAAWAAGVAHGREEAWREIEIIAGDSLPRDWGRIAREVREVRG